MGRGISFASQGLVRFTLTLALAGTLALDAIPACSSGEDFTAKSTGGASNTGGKAGDASTTGGAGGGGGTGGIGGTSASGGVAGSGSGGVAGSGSGGVAGSASGGAGGNPSGKDNGQACASKIECKSNYCVDDVCCDNACSGECRTCKLVGKEGTCTPYAPTTDPEGECVGAGAPTDPCAGTCDGKSACDFPDPNKSCGAQVCTNATKSTFACDNAGACKKADVSCGNYQCSGANCLTNCSVDTECVANTYCEIPVCSPKKSLGAVCPKDSACQSNHCVAGNCCSSTCLPNYSCETGNCQCGGQTCPAGDACTVWYQDADGDKFGNSGVPALGCASKGLLGYVANNTDCYDTNANAKPGQTQFFDTDRGDGSYDYNCDNSSERKYPVVNTATCKLCNPPSPTGCGITNCTQAAGFGCAAIIGCPLDKSGFVTDPGCGKVADLKTCNATLDINFNCTGATVVTTAGTKQACR